MDQSSRPIRRARNLDQTRATVMAVVRMSMAVMAAATSYLLCELSTTAGAMTYPGGSCAMVPRDDAAAAEKEQSRQSKEAINKEATTGGSRSQPCDCSVPTSPPCCKPTRGRLACMWRAKLSPGPSAATHLHAAMHPCMAATTEHPACQTRAACPLPQMHVAQ
jgi:hypothetical protein